MRAARGPAVAPLSSDLKAVMCSVAGEEALLHGRVHPGANLRAATRKVKGGLMPLKESVTAKRCAGIVRGAMPAEEDIIARGNSPRRPIYATRSRAFRRRRIRQCP